MSQVTGVESLPRLDRKLPVDEDSRREAASCRICISVCWESVGFVSPYSPRICQRGECAAFRNLSASSVSDFNAVSLQVIFNGKIDSVRKVRM